MTRQKRLMAVLPAVAAVIVAGHERPLAAQDTKSECIAASDRAQQLRIEGKLRSAREALATCGRDACPALVRADCAKWMSEVLASLPSVVIGAHDAQGRDLINVRVLVDGVIVQDKLEGKPVPLDPGSHTIRYETTGAQPVEERVLLREGEKNRPLTVSFGGQPGAGPPTASATQKPTPAVETTTVKRDSPANTVVGLVLGGVGLAAVAGGIYFELKQNSDANDLVNSPCAASKTCPPDAVTTVQNERIYGGVGIGVGVVAIAAATFFLLAHPIQTTETQTKQTGIRLDAAPMPGGGFLGLRGAF